MCTAVNRGRNILKISQSAKWQTREGDEKGYFKFGGSTVIIVVPAGALRFDDDLLGNSGEGLETLVRFGERIARVAVF